MMCSRLKILITITLLTISAVIALKWNLQETVLYKPQFKSHQRVAVPRLKLAEPDAGLNETQSKIFKLNVSEELILQLTPTLKQIIQHLEEGGLIPSDIFLNACQINEPKENGVTLADAVTANLPQDISWPLTDLHTMGNPKKLWSEISSQATFSKTQFGVVSGELMPGGNTFVMKTIFEGNLIPKDDAIANSACGAKATQILYWKRSSEDRWQIQKWEQLDFQLQVVKKPLFADVTNPVVKSSSAIETIQKSEIVDLLKKELRGEQFSLKSDKMFQLFNDWHSSAQYSSVSVVDFNNDQWDDLFLTNNLGKTLLLENNQAGSFKDVSEQSGLQLDRGYVNCALFADFDNDGDKDVLLGRNFKQCLYFENSNGKFQLDAEVCERLVDCKLVSAGSVTDINGDGLLDVYLSTYSQTLGNSQEWINHAVPPRQSETLRQKSQFRHSYLDRAGPPNIVLININGKLEPLEPSGPLAQWRNSFQSVWLDYDCDGDQDVYICNDFAPDVLLENQTARDGQQPSFKDVTKIAFGAGLMGFGMGASVGDYDSDGLLDIYVSNMYSKAGNRIFQQLDGNVHPSLKVAAAGNFLYRNLGNGEFSQEAGVADLDQHVAKVGWSYGGQMADFNNDGKLDIYVPSGLFTPPAEVDAQEDL